MEHDAHAGREVAELLADTEAERDSLVAALQMARNQADAERRQRLEDEAIGGPPAAALEAVQRAEGLASENATLRAENAAMQSELSALSPQFFEEIEDLKYAYAVARQQLDRMEAAYGPAESLPTE